MTAGLLVLASPLLLGACTSSDEVRRAQATADQALATAQAAHSEPASGHGGDGGGGCEREG